MNIETLPGYFKVIEQETGIKALTLPGEQL